MNIKIKNTNKTYLSHTVSKPALMHLVRTRERVNPEEIYAIRIISILQQGLVPGYLCYNSEYFHDTYRENSRYIFYSLSDDLGKVWQGTKEFDLATIFIRNSYIKEHNNKFMNGSFRSKDGQYITRQRDDLPDKYLENRGYFNEFLEEYNIKDIPENTSVRRLCHQVVSSTISPSGFEKIVFYDSRILDLTRDAIPQNVEVYIAPFGISRDLERII